MVPKRSHYVPEDAARVPIDFAWKLIKTKDGFACAGDRLSLSTGSEDKLSLTAVEPVASCEASLARTRGVGFPRGFPQLLRPKFPDFQPSKTRAPFIQQLVQAWRELQKR